MAEIIPFPGKQQTESLAGAQLPNPTAGRVLALNPEKIKRFQCRGFWLNSRTPYARVPAEASSGQLRAALDDGRLLDITDQIEDYRRGGKLVVSGSEIGQAAQLEVTNKKIYFVKRAGETCALIPETPEQGAELERQAAAGSPLILPPGFDDPDKYLIRLTGYTPEATA
jgi:hypothetical protein